MTAEQIYKLYFHGPGFQVLKGILNVSQDLVVAELAPLPANCGAETVQGLPRYIEAMFQACGYRDLHFDKKTALPDTIDSLNVYTEVMPAGALYVEGRYKGRDEAGKSVYDAVLYGEDGKALVALNGYRMIPI